MDADKYLGQLRVFSRLIAMKRREAEMWRSVALGSASGMDADRVQASPNQDRMADAVSKAMDYEKAAEALTWQLINLQLEIVEKLDNMPTTDYGILLSDYYVNGMTVQEIAAEWNYSWRHIQRMKADALKEFAEKYGES